MLIQSILVALGATLTAAVQPLKVQGNSFVNTEGNKFYIIGVAYQPGGSAGYDPTHGEDPLSNKDICLRDAALMQVLGVNTIRVYNLSPNINHDECASIFNAAGIYMLLDVNSPLAGESIHSLEPWTSYYDTYLNRTFAIVEAFKNYPNTLAFFSGNEVMNNIETAEYAPRYVRAVTRDLKNYIAKHCDRPIPVGYSAADVREVLADSFNYLTCAENGDESDPSRADLFALNSYSWCGDASFTTAGYDKLVAIFKETPVPVFFSEAGCNEVRPRIFTEVQAIYGPEMANLSGVVMYEYVQEPNNYGLVEIGDKESAEVLVDFYALQKQFAQLDIKNLQGSKASSSSPKPVSCSSGLITTKGFDANFTLPDLPPNAQGIIDNGVSPKPVGKIVSISSWAVPQAVKNSDGSVISGLAVKPLKDDATNTPGSNSAGSVASGTNSSTNGTAGGNSDDSAGSSTMPLSSGFITTGCAVVALILAFL